MSGHEAIGAVEGASHGSSAKHSFQGLVSDGYDPSQDPSLYGLADYQLAASQSSSSSELASKQATSVEATSGSNNSFENMGESMGMSGEDMKKFMDNLLQSITSTIKTDTDHAVEALKQIDAEMQRNSQ
jgi:hypothetical protein